MISQATFLATFPYKRHTFTFNLFLHPPKLMLATLKMETTYFSKMSG